MVLDSSGDTACNSRAYGKRCGLLNWRYSDIMGGPRFHSLHFPRISPRALVPTMAHLSPHLQQIKERAEAFQSSFPLVDNFPPSFSPDDGPEIAGLISQGISYYYTTKVFVKRQPHRDELGTDIFGRPAVYGQGHGRVRLLPHGPGPPEHSRGSGYVRDCLHCRLGDGRLFSSGVGDFILESEWATGEASDVYKCKGRRVGFV